MVKSPNKTSSLKFLANNTPFEYDMRISLCHEERERMSQERRENTPIHIHNTYIVCMYVNIDFSDLTVIKKDHVVPLHYILYVQSVYFYVLYACVEGCCHLSRRQRVNFFFLYFVSLFYRDRFIDRLFLVYLYLFYFYFIYF